MKLLTIKELSQILKVKESTLYAWVHRGKIPSFKLNGLLRFDQNEIEQWISNSKVKAKSSSRLIMPQNPQDINAIFNKVIDGTMRKRYNSTHRKPGLNQGLRKEA